MIRKVTAYDGALLEEARPAVHDVIAPEVARTMTAMLEDTIQHGTGIKARSLQRPVGGKTGTTNDFTDAWFIGFSPTLTAGVWVGNDDKQISLGKKETGAMTALPIWIQFMQAAEAGAPVQDFANVVSLDKQAEGRMVSVDTPDNAPTEPSEQGLPVGGQPAVAPKPKPPIKQGAGGTTQSSIPH